ncbi:GerMN domain-containing protein [Geodermatophilus sp. DSM 44513]|uniref:GerMN domain-containing protein n=1 Tax=Geodermatophilus sp. DSM 44513 TaxID=1528104 RepID=UPI00126B789A|nr:GerMN domain-containing protein [Geodermatophilus sp. DSM 44513]WNV76839.1 GerMN domain-containing protein [Geodermatophilus sp. DSM 44513]
MSARRTAGSTALAVSLLLTSACGVPTGGEPETIASTDIPYGLASTTPTSAPAPPPAARSNEPRIYLVTAEGVLVPRGRTSGDGSLEQRLTRLLAGLAAGPTSGERGDQLTSALPPEVRLSLTTIEGGTATIDISAPENAPSGRESRQAVGQVVLTATSLPGIEGVVLTRDGGPVEAPLLSGELTTAPLTAEDYDALLTSPPS